MLRFLALCALVFNGVRAGETFGTEIGTLKSSKNGISGQVFHVNSTFVQIRRFTINEGLNVKFAVSSATQVGLVKNLYELKSNKDGVDFLEPVDLLLSDAFDDKTLIAELPKKKKEESWQFFGVINEKEWKYLAATSFDNKVVPSKFCCLAPLNGWAFGLKSGPVDVLDSKTLRVADFSFDGHKAPDAWFFVGKDSIDKKNARRCAILKRDTKMLQCPLKEEFQQQTLVINLPKNLTIHDVQWLSVMSPGADVDFGHTAIKLSKNQGIQPHLPPISEQDAILEAQGWPATKLIAVPQGKETEIKFTLGPAAGTKAKSLRGSCDSLEKVWYAEGLMQPEIWLQRGTRYVFQIFGGKSNPFYMTTDKEGGFATKNTTEKKNIINILGDKGQAVGQLCEHAMVNDQTDPDSFADFSDFSPNLVLNCPSKKRSFEIKWGADTTDLNDFYYGSYKAKFMGGKVRLCDRIDDSDENDPKCLRFKKSKKIVKTVL